MQTLAARQLREAFEPKCMQTFMKLFRSLDDLRPQHSRVRVQIKDQSVGLLHIIDRRSPRMNFQRADLNE